jgi:hypothetical protein
MQLLTGVAELDISAYFNLCVLTTQVVVPRRMRSKRIQTLVQNIADNMHRDIKSPDRRDQCAYSCRCPLFNNRPARPYTNTRIAINLSATDWFS